MALRKAGDLPELINAAIRSRGYDVVNPGDEFDYGPLQQQLAQGGSALLRPNDLRSLMGAAESPRRAAQMSPQERLARIGEYLSSMEGLRGAPMLFPVTRGSGAAMQTLGASVIDGDRLVSYALSAPNGSELLFVPGASSAPLTHVAEKVVATERPEHFEGSGPMFHYGTMPTDVAREIYKQAASRGYQPTEDGPLQEEFYYDTDLIHAPGPAIMDLYKAIGAQQGQGPSMFNIVPSRGGQYDVLGMRQGMRTMGTARLPYEPGWLGNPYKAVDAGGPYTREEATRLFGELVEQKAQDPQWRDAFLSLAGKNVGYYKPEERHIHLHALQDWLTRNTSE